ncbi:hypothetical protein Taro_040343 [Colocasia esculenta]|uniref:Uncharacterized protein n=1 Tax=Colocasia esculenta TaxID=4460 RepID=A0A843W8Q9_COLES|nr:hypothetical protein [Colocasia esculenta]
MQSREISREYRSRPLPEKREGRDESVFLSETVSPPFASTFEGEAFSMESSFSITNKATAASHARTSLNLRSNSCAECRTSVSSASEAAFRETDWHQSLSTSKLGQFFSNSSVAVERRSGSPIDLSAEVARARLLFPAALAATANGSTKPANAVSFS